MTMANLKTWKRGSMTNVIGEATRELDEYKNNVDKERTHLNYNLIEGSETRADIIAKVNTRVHDVMGDKIKPQTRKNMKPLGTWVVTLPQELNDLSDDEKRDFFETALEFVGDRYGKENLVYAAVHMDENQPHMHVGVVPVCTSRKTGKETVSSASMFTKKDLKTFHDDLDALMETKYGKARLMKNGRTKGNYTLDELKERTQTEERLAKQQAELDKQSAEITQVQTELMETVWPAVKQLNRERPKVAEQKAKNEADAKRLAERQKALQEYQQKLIDWRDNQTAVFESRKASLEAREAKVAEREAEAEKMAERASESLREASETLEEAKAEAKGIIARAKAQASAIKARALEVLNKIPLVNKMLVHWAEEQVPEDRKETENVLDAMTQYGVKEPSQTLTESTDEREQRHNMELLEAMTMLTAEDLDDAKDKADDKGELTREDVHEILEGLQDLQGSDMQL